MDGENRQVKANNPRAEANCLSAITFSWVLRIFMLGYRRDIETDDLYSPLKEHTSNILGERIAKAWKDELKKTSIDIENTKRNDQGGVKNVTRKLKEPSLLRVLLKCFGARIMMYGIVVGIGHIVLGVGQPLLIGHLLRYYNSNTSNVKLTKTEAYIYATGVIVCSILKAFVTNSYLMAITHMGMKIRVACCTLIYRKILRFSKTALGNTTVGQIINLLSNDVNRFDYSLLFVNYLWIGPLQTIIIGYFMYTEFGISAIIGITSMLLFIPLQGFLGSRAAHYRLRTAKRTDERVRITNEIINGIQAIKMYTWEKPFGDLVERARKREINVITSASYIHGIVISFTLFCPRFCVFITILGYVLLGDEITADKVFMLIAYFDVLRDAMTVRLPRAMTYGAETIVSIRRLQNFLMYDEAQNTRSTEGDKKADEAAGKGSVKMENAGAKWLETSKDDTLRNINIDVKPGQLVAIVGQVGSGKSSLLHAILRELPLNSGTVKALGNIAYASQDPWLFAGSIRQNILFGCDMDPHRYERVIKVCQLKRDFTLFPYGDRTVVGERGISLSGGQRARVNLARAVYAKADIYLMDDPLSAVDTHVGKHMFDECIAGYLNGKTRILVTHQIQYLRNVDRIIVLKDGAVQAQGTYDELQNSKIDLGQLLETFEANKPVYDQRQLSRTVSLKNSSKSDDLNGMTDSLQQDKTPKEEAEARSSGTVSGKVYADYFRAAGNWCILPAILTPVVFTQVLASSGDYFISLWVDLEEENASRQDEKLAVEWDSILSRELCIYIYSGLVIATVVFTLVRSISFYAVCMRASKRLHDKMFRGISRATMRFFNTNSSGRILNRFSKDMGTVDELVPNTMIDCVQISLGLFGVIIVISITNPWLMIPTFAVGVVLYYIRVIYLATSRSVKRLEGITRSPVFGHLSATLQGLTTIRAFGAGEILTKEFDCHQDLHSSVWFIHLGTTRAFVFWLELVCVFYVALVTYSFLVIPNHDSTGGNVGLAITQSIALMGIFQWGMRQSAELEIQMTAVERVLEYSVVDQEPPLESSPENKPDPNWPSKGQIEFQELSMQYGPDEPVVLKNLNFVVKPRQKIGIVGRTGAGKSSLVAALFRLAYESGKIVIDGIESRKLGLHDLRSKISIIPQEPFLFFGTLRRNLDPFDEYPDSALWQALEEVKLKEMGIESHIAEGGSNLSVGQRQLVCLARAIVRNNRILILDEATANVDLMTDELIQRTIREKFANCTVLTIAHRLNTVMDSDRVLVMDAGTVVEYDHPHVLLQKENGYLRCMVDQTGQSMANALALVAKNSYRLEHER